MKIRYEVTVDDLVAFTFYQSGRSLARRRPGGIVWVIFAEPDAAADRPRD